MSRIEAAAAAFCEATPSGTAPATAPATRPPRSRPDLFMRRLLRVPDGPRTVDAESAQRMFGQSIAISAARCLLTYVLLPIVAPLVGAATGIGPAAGIPLGIVAMTFDVLAVRRFWLADHRYRWLCTWLYAVIITFLTVLLVHDVITVFT